MNVSRVTIVAAMTGRIVFTQSAKAQLPLRVTGIGLNAGTHAIKTEVVPSKMEQRQGLMFCKN